jgi:hypothetical protein
MKTRLLIIVIIIVLISVTIFVLAEIYQKQVELKEKNGFLKDTTELISDPLCFTNLINSGDGENIVSREMCIPLRHLEVVGCTKPILYHISQYTNLLDDDFDVTVLRNFVGLPDGVSEKEYEQCFEFLHERRTKLFEKDPESTSPVMGKINPEKNIPMFFEIQLMEQEIEWDLADRTWTNTDEGIVYPAKICSHIIKESGAELYIYTILEDEYSLSDMFMQREMPDNCAKFFPVAEVARK